MGLRRAERGRSFGHVNRVMVFEAFYIIVERDPASSATICCSSVGVDCSGSRQIVSGKKMQGNLHLFLLEPMRCGCLLRDSYPIRLAPLAISCMLDLSHHRFHRQAIDA